MSTEQQILVFTLDDKAYGFAVSKIKEVIALPPCTTVPLGPEFLLGLINYKNTPLPVYCLEAIFGLPYSTERRLCLIVQSRLGLLGYAIDAVEGIRSLSKAIQVEARIKDLPGELRIIATLQLAQREHTVQILDN